MTDAFAILLSRELKLSARAPVTEEDEEGGAEVCPKDVAVYEMECSLAFALTTC
jgi:hypothetical protein